MNRALYVFLCRTFEISLTHATRIQPDDLAHITGSLGCDHAGWVPAGEQNAKHTQVSGCGKLSLSLFVQEHQVIDNDRELDVPERVVL